MHFTIIIIYEYYAHMKTFMMRTKKRAKILKNEFLLLFVKL